MKGKMVMSALFALMLMMGISTAADAAPYGRYHRGPACRPRCGVVRVVPPRPRVVYYGGHHRHYNGGGRYHGGSYGHPHHGGAHHGGGNHHNGGGHGHSNGGYAHGPRGGR